MKINLIENINPIDSKLSNLISEPYITYNELNNNINANTLVINVFDAFDNFLLQRIYKEGSYNFNYDNESQFTRDIQSLIEEDENLNSEGIYNLRYYFVGDVFDYINNNNNTFIVTEISADNTELRLNPKSNEESFITRFNRFKNYIKPTPVSETLKQQVNKVLTLYVNSTLVRDYIGPIVFQSTVILKEGGAIGIFNYLSKFYTNKETGIILTNIATQIINSKEAVKDKMSKIILADEEVIELYSEYKNNPIESNFDEVEKRIFDLFNENIISIVFEIASVNIESQIQQPEQGGGGQPS